MYSLDENKPVEIRGCIVFVDGEEGLNKYGLFVSMIFVITDLKDIQPGMNSVSVVCYLLGKAHCVEEAVTLLKPFPASSNFNILLITKQKKMVVVERTPQKKNIQEPILVDNGIKIISTVNSFTLLFMQ